MNINTAKTQIKNALIAYLTKDSYGNYVIPVERQRPIFLIGAPGIGKTAIMQQVANELGIGLVTYSMTHHTRQSAIGLPFITEKTYDNKTFSVSEYTMSEIIASVYNRIENNGQREGILFLDEINCVSETLAPTMLQFLQYKTFGGHEVPKGWIIVTAGNPPEYNNSVREFDVVTLDRLKRIDVSYDYETWEKYAVNTRTHPAILSFLKNKPGSFYKIESSAGTKRFVTARSWSDMSDMLYVFEQHNLPVDRDLISQYIQTDEIATSFTAHYDLFMKYKSDYKLDDILAGHYPDEIKKRARTSNFDEHLALLFMLVSRINTETAKIIQHKESTEKISDSLRPYIAQLTTVAPSRSADKLREIAAEQRAVLAKAKEANSIDIDKQHVAMDVIDMMEQWASDLAKSRPSTMLDVRNFLMEKIKERSKDTRAKAKVVSAIMENVFNFLAEVYNKNQEMVIFVTELTINSDTAKFISSYGCESYFKYNKELLVNEKIKSLIEQIRRAQADSKPDDDDE